jgi:hypothetical protein
MEQVKTVHLTDSKVLEQYENITDIRKEIDTFIKHEPVFNTYLDEICSNVVGNTMMKMLVANMKKTKKQIKLYNNYLSLVDSSFYSYGEQVISVKLCYYDKDGIGVPDRIYFGVDEKGTIVEKGKSLCRAIFHESVHALHESEDSVDKTKLENFWHDQEERRTIAGYIDGTVFDPICENCFDMYDSLVKHIEFLPRIGHVGLIKSAGLDLEKGKLKLRAFYKEQNFELDWCKIYMR